MTRVGLKGLFLAMAACSLMAVGCADKDKQIAELTRQYNSMRDERDKIKADSDAQIAQLASEKSRLEGQLADKTLECSQKEAELRDLKSGKAGKAGAKDAGKAAAGWEATAQGDKISVGTDVLFAAGQGTLTAEGKKALNKIVGDLKGPYANLPVRVYGYTDIDPISKTKKQWQDNLDLSANRAMAVTRYLISNGIKADRIETIGMGETHPIASNATKDGKAKNRRVDVVVVK